MSTAFLRTLRSLESDGFRRTLLGLLLVAILLGGWLAWFFLAGVARYEVTDRARLEVGQASHLLQAPLAGRVLRSRLVLDAPVEAGEILVELDANPERLQLQEEQARVRAIGPQVEALRAEIAASEQARQREQQATRLALEEARARHREAVAQAKVAETEARRLERLHKDGLIPLRDLEQGAAEAQRRTAAAESLATVAERLEGEQRTRDSDREAQRERLAGHISRLEGDRTTLAATIARLEYEIDRRRVRAPISGRLGEVAVLREGAVVAEGEKLGAVVPSGALRVVAEFAPPAALGRIRPGQAARLRLLGFPWAQYGSIRAKVASVAGEVRGGSVRVELEVAPDASPRIRFQHGLPGAVEVEVERISPAALTLRAAGQLLSAPRTSFQTQTP